MKRDKQLMAACKKYPEAILWLYKYTTSACFYNNESVTYGPFIAGLAKNYGVRYDNCGWNGAMDDLLGEGKASYPSCAGVGTVMEQCGFRCFEREWWHYKMVGEPYPDTYFDFPVK